MDGTISYDGNSLQTYNRATQIGIITDDFDIDSPGVKNNSFYPLAHANDSVNPASDTPNKIFPITGTIKSDTPANLDVLIDTFKGYFNSSYKNLDVTYGAGVRRYQATEDGLTIKRSANKKFARFSLTFSCKPFGTNTTSTTALSVTGRSLASYIDPHTFIGSAPGQLPIVTITLASVSATGVQQMFWGNDDTGQSITISRSGWAAADVIVIDCRNGGSITVNGNPFDFSGAFPEFTKGAHPMIYGDTFTSRNFSEQVIYYPRYR